MTDQISRSGGGIVRGSGGSGVTPNTGDPHDTVRALRRRWASGVTVVTLSAPDGRLRGLTATSFMVVSEEPAIVAVAIAVDGEFAALVALDSLIGISLLEASHEFQAERFAGRAPLPDGRFTGIDHRLEHSVPILNRTLGWCVGRVTDRIEVGDHWMLLISVVSGGFGEDTDDPLLRYEGGYRRLEAS